MGRFVNGENVYILAKITEVDPDDSKRYRLETAYSKFYAHESVDTLRSNPAEVFTANELYAILVAIANMSSADITICFGDGFTKVEDVLKAGFSITEIRTKYRDWQFDNEISKGDMVYYKKVSTDTPKTCLVLGVTEGTVDGTSTDNQYLLYYDADDSYITATRTQITSAHKRSEEAIAALNDMDEAAETARKEIG